MSEEPQFYIGRRLSYANLPCTVRYFGPLPGTKGDWLGVEWDDPTRGKHDGSYDGKKIFQCRCGAASCFERISPLVFFILLFNSWVTCYTL